MITEHDLSHQLVRVLDLVMTGPVAKVTAAGVNIPVRPIDSNFTERWLSHLDAIDAGLREAQAIVSDLRNAFGDR